MCQKNEKQKTMQKKHLFILLILFSVIYANAQATIVKKDNTRIDAKILSVTKDGVTYIEDQKTGQSFLKKSAIRNIIYNNSNKHSELEDKQICEIHLPEIGLKVVCWDLEKEIKWYDAVEQAPRNYRLPTLQELKYMCKIQKMIGLRYQDEYWSLTSKKKNAFSVTCNDCKKEKNSKNRTRAIRYVRNY